MRGCRGLKVRDAGREVTGLFPQGSIPPPSNGEGSLSSFFSFSLVKHVGRRSLRNVLRRKNWLVKLVKLVLTGVTAVILGPIKRAVGVHLQVVALPAV